jgi:hypothetical protein
MKRRYIPRQAKAAKPGKQVSGAIDWRKLAPQKQPERKA